MKKRILAMVLVITMCFSMLIGCNSTKDTSTQSDTDVSTTDSQDSATESEEQATDSTEREEITLSIANGISKDVAPNHDVVNKLLKEKFNITVEWTDLSSTSALEQMNLLFSTGEYPDMLWNWNGESDLKRWATQGYLYSVDEYLDLIPNYTALFTEEEWNLAHTYASNADGKLYYLPFKNYRSTSETWLYRTGMLEELNLSVPKTTDELYTVLKAYKEKYPDSIPIANRWGLGNMLKGFQLAYRTKSGFFFDTDSNQLEYGPATDKYREMLTYVAKLYSEGLIDREFQTATDTQWEEVYANGLNILEYSYTNRAEWANNTMKNADPEANWQWTSDYITAYPDKEELTPRELPYLAWGPFFTKAMTEEEVERWMEVINWACSEEGQRFFSMGEEGITYELQSDAPVFLSNIYSTSNPEGTTLEELGYGPYMIRSRESLEQTGYADDLKLSEIVADRSYLPFVSYALTEDQEKTLVDPETQINDIYQEYILRFITGNMDPSNDSDWNKYLEKLEMAGLDEVKKIRQSVAIIGQ